MPIKISKALRDKLPAEQKATIEELLLQKHGGKCFLCDGDFNMSIDVIYADHDVPVDAGGATDKNNLNLVHKQCNDFKRNYPSVQVRPYLKLQKFLGLSYKYGDCLPHFGISPQPVGFKDGGQTVSLDLPDATKVETAVFSESNSEGAFRYFYALVPRSAIFNDDQCQPRTIKTQQLWAIYADLQRNPLHEPPSCRLIVDGAGQGMAKLVMFDGQHKTLANWLMNRQAVVAKVYLNLSREQAIRLVNSIQAKIKKLPLSVFELAAKMAEEWGDRFRKYTDTADPATTSEAGFLAWVDKDEKARAKAAFVDTLYQNVLGSEDLEFKQRIAGKGGTATEQTITETTFRNKVLKPLLHLEPLGEPLEASNTLRDREAELIVRMLNLFTQKVFEPDAPGAALTELQQRRARRVFYQSSLLYLAGLLRQIVGHVMTADKSREFLDKEPGPDQWKRIGRAIDVVLSHPVWTASFDYSNKMKQVEAALTKNQDAEKAFKNVHLKLGYALEVDALDAECLADAGG